MSPADWRSLITAFVDGQLDGPIFEQRFLEAHSVGVQAGETVPYAVDCLFYEVDAYCADPALFSAGDNTEDDLRNHAKRALGRFDEPWPDIGPLGVDDLRDKRLLDIFRQAASRLGLLRK